MQHRNRTVQSVLSFQLLGFLLLSATLSAQQSPVCVANAGNSNLRAEGLAESAPDITLSCSGATPNVPATATVSIFTPVNITNHLSTGNTPDVIVTVMAAGVQQPAPATVQLVGSSELNISGIQYTPGGDGGVTIKISNLRLNVNSAAVAGKTPLLTANILATGLTITNTQVQLGAIATGLLTSENSAPIYGLGAALPQGLTMQNLFTAGTSFTTTRVTEGFSNAFIPKDANSNAGTRIMVTYTGLPSSLELVVPDLIAGSSAFQETSAGDLGLPQSPGVYAPSATGSLLLARVNGALADGSGGSPFPRPAAGVVTNLSSATALQVVNGNAMVVYEVVDSNPLVQESAQIPTFVALTSATSPGTYGGLSLSFAPVSTVGVATMTDPVPRFAAVTPGSDCTVIGDCNASYYPRLQLNISSISLQAPENGARAVGYLPFQNAGGGNLQWTASISYQTGSGWLSLESTSGSGNTTIGVFGNPANLSPGTYNATITINAGPTAGSKSVPVTFTVGLPVPLITQVSSAANGFVSSLVAGSFASVYGTGLAGSNVSVTFDGAPASLTYMSASQINLLVPAELAGKTTSQMVVTVDGRTSAPMTVNLATSAPAIFTNGVLNQDSSVNSAANPAVHGTTLQIFLTGLPPVAGATVNIGNTTLQSVFSGQAPGVPGLEQVNVMLPANLTGTAQLTVCTAPPSPVCSPAYSVTIQ